MISAGRRLAAPGTLLAVSLLATVLLITACAAQSLDTELPTIQAARTISAVPLPEHSVTPAPSATPALMPAWTPEPTAVPTESPSLTPTPGCDQAGQIITGRFPSALAPPDLAYRIYLPPCYGQDGRLYPVLYMLPGNIPRRHRGCGLCQNLRTCSSARSG